MLSEVEHHDHEYKKHHDGARVNDDFKRCDKRGTEHVEDHRHREQRHDQVEQRVHDVQTRKHQNSRQDGYRARDVKSQFHINSRQKRANVNGRPFMLCLALILAADLNAGYTPVVVTRILARAVDQQIFLFIDQVAPVKLPQFEIRRKLNGVGRAGLFAPTAEDAAREIDAKELRKTPARFVLRGLQRDASNRARDCTELAGHAALASIGIARQNDPAPVARGEIRFLLRVLNGDSLLEGMKKNVPNCPEYAEHPNLSRARQRRSRASSPRPEATSPSSPRT